MKNINWMHVMVLGLVALGVFALGMGVLLLLGGTWGMMGTRMMGPGHMGGDLLWGALWLTAACLLPLTLLTLLVVGGVWLLGNLSPTQGPQVSVERCESCGRATESGWQVCPYCGEDLDDE